MLEICMLLPISGTEGVFPSGNISWGDILLQGQGKTVYEILASGCGNFFSIVQSCRKHTIILPLFSIIMVLALIVGIGSQTLVSMELGRKNSDKAQDAMSTGFRAMVGTSLIATVLLLLFAEPLTKLMGADKRLLPFSLAYLKGLVPFILPLSLCFYSDAMLKALGHPKFSMVIM
ncbi:MAG: MATE family efflux transporter, partial [Anaerolineaceae bacterium]|nr:MATE family efflux transporter [Anaerolineaceae bacterium]